MERLKLETIENIIGVEKTTIEAFEKNGEIATLDKCILMGMEELKQYRIDEEQDLLLRLPFKLPSMIWVAKKGEFTHKCFYEVPSQVISDMEHGYVFGFTKEEAEQALAKMKEV